MVRREEEDKAEADDEHQSHAGKIDDAESFPTGGPHNPDKEPLKTSLEKHRIQTDREPKEDNEERQAIFLGRTPYVVGLL